MTLLRPIGNPLCTDLKKDIILVVKFRSQIKVIGEEKIVHYLTYFG